METKHIELLQVKIQIAFERPEDCVKCYGVFEEFIKELGEALFIADVSNSFLKDKMIELENEVSRIKEFTGLDQF